MKTFVFWAVAGFLGAGLPLAAQSGATLTTLYDFGAGGNRDAHNPRAGLVPGSNGVLYGTTFYGGASTACPHGCGAVYQLTPPASPGGAWTESVVYSFKGGADGDGPESAVVAGSDGTLYGTTCCGGSGKHGTAYELMPPAVDGGAWTHAILHDFGGSPDGTLPYAGLTIGPNGVLYGVTEEGGDSKACKKGCGTAFALTPPASGDVWTESVLYTFANGRRDGSAPRGELLLDPQGVLYGTTSTSKPSKVCPYGCGKVFRLTPPAVGGGAWKEALVDGFVYSNGSRPLTRLIFGPNGAIYGTTDNGGTATTCDHGCGTVFQRTPPSLAGRPWTSTVLHSFTGNAGGGDGAQPWSGVTLGANGVLYGETVNGGAGSCKYPGSPGCGSVFQLTPPSTQGGAWAETVLLSFMPGSGGAAPEGNLYVASDGTLYGTTSVGGLNQRGTAFALKP